MIKRKTIINSFVLAATLTVSMSPVAAATITPNAFNGGSGASTYPGTPYTAVPGDILVTNSTSSAGLTGHAGIVVDYAGDVASIAGTGYHPQIYSMSSWWTNYPNERLIRVNQTAEASAAANWATNFVNNNASEGYTINSVYSLYSGTYCSKIVWDAWYYGGNEALPYSSSTNICAPYQLSDTSQYVQSVSYLWGNW